MTPDELIAAGVELYGSRWKAPMARALDIDPSSLWRYATGQVAPIPGPVAAAVQCFLREKRARPISKPPPADPNE